jgi:hypothetical protein
LYLTNLYLPVIFEFRLRQGLQTFQWKNSEEAICILFVLRLKKQFLYSFGSRRRHINGVSESI